MSSASTVLDPLREGPTSSTSLVQALRLSQPTVSRALTALQREGRVLKMGATRGARYAVPRPVADAGTLWPVFQVDTAGRIREVGRLHALMPRHFYFETTRATLRGLSEGLPWFLRDQIPAGFLGDGLAAAHPELGLPSQAADWSEDHYLSWCTRHGWDCVGDLIVGMEASEAYRDSLQPRQLIRAAERSMLYPRIAEQEPVGGQYAAQLPGAQPKFTALVDHGGHRVQAIVKFSPPLDTPAGQRWGDLLMAEHLALVHLNARGVGAAHSRVFRFGGRIFLEVDRFDRVGAEGRRGMVSLQTLERVRSGALHSWSVAATNLAGMRVLPKNDARQIRLIEAFARLIGNSGAHFGNLALYDHHDGSFALAPVFDMLPMLFAPEDGELVERAFVVPETAADTADVWPHARKLAESYWERLAAEAQLSSGFRKLCAGALAALRAAP